MVLTCLLTYLCFFILFGIGSFKSNLTFKKWTSEFMLKLNCWFVDSTICNFLKIPFGTVDNFLGCCL